MHRKEAIRTLQEERFNNARKDGGICKLMDKSGDVMPVSPGIAE